MSPTTAPLPVRAEVTGKEQQQQARQQQKEQIQQEKQPGEHQQHEQERHQDQQKKPPQRGPANADLLDPHTDDQQLLRQVIDFYRGRFAEHPPAQEFLLQRGLAHPELTGTFQVGFADRQLNRRLPPKQSRAGAALRGRLKRLGILHATGHAHFNGCLTVPLVDAQGHIRQIYGHRIRKHLTRGTCRDVWLPRNLPANPASSDPLPVFFNLAALSAHDEIILAGKE